MPDQKTAIITGASRGIGAGLVGAFLKQGYNVVATSRNVSQKLTASTALVLIDGDIGKPETAAKVVEAAIKNFGSIDVLVSNAGIFLTKPFTEFSTADFNALVSNELAGISIHHSAYCETDAEAKIRKRRKHHRRTCRSTDPWRRCLGPNDH
jgi:NAD(P)-dependent dehydrogenase (short-subunit alcohol dehydrogenase family)